MELKQTGPSRSPWRSAATGGLIAATVPIILGLALSLSMGEGAQEGIGWIFVAGILASPVIFVLGAAGGLLAHVARGSHAAAPVDARATRLRRAGWALSGAVAGYAASALTSFQWPIPGGILIGAALIPIWVWIGAALGQRVAVLRSSSRPILGGLIVAGAAHAVVRVLVGMAQPRLGHFRSSAIAAVCSVVAGLFTLVRLLDARRSATRDGDAPG